METFDKGHLVTAGDWNEHVNQINQNTTDIASLDTRLDSGEASITTLESRTTNASTGNAALGNRVNTLETLPFIVLRKSADQMLSHGPDGGWDQVVTWQTTEAGSTPTMKSGDTIVIPSAGAYLISATMNIAGGGSSPGVRILYITKNSTNDVGNTAIAAQQLPGKTDAGGLGTGLAVSTIRQLAQGDVLRVMAYQSSDAGVSLAIRPNSFGGTTFAVRKIK